MAIDISKLLDEFRGKTNHEAYELAFTKRLMRQDPQHPGKFLGNTQREDFVPHLLKLTGALPDGAQIYDIGAGRGEIADIAFTNLRNATINLLEPNPILLSQYEERLRHKSNLKPGIKYCGLLEDYYQSGPTESPKPAEGQDLVLSIHMLYHLTNPRADTIDPDADIVNAMKTMYSFLKPGGSIFLIFANQLVSTTGKAGRYYFRETGQPQLAERLKQIAESRVRLLTKDIGPILQEQFPNDTVTVDSITTDSCIFGENESDIVAMCVTAEIGEINDEPFDLEKLAHCARFVDEHRNDIGLKVEERSIPQKGMFRSNQPQIISAICRGDAMRRPTSSR